MENPKAAEPSSSSAWTFLTNQAHVLVCIAQDPHARMRDVAAKVRITERAVQRIVAELEEAGYLSHARDGRTNWYTVHTDLPLRHPVERHCRISTLIGIVLTHRKGETGIRVPRAQRRVQHSSRSRS